MRGLRRAVCILLALGCLIGMLPVTAFAGESLLESGVRHAVVGFDYKLTRAIADGLDPTSADQLMWRYEQIVHERPAASWWQAPAVAYQQQQRLATLQADLDAAYARSLGEQRDGFVRGLHLWNRLVIEAQAAGVTTDGLDETQASFAHYATLAATPGDFGALARVLGNHLVLLQDRLSDFRTARVDTSISLASARSLLAQAGQYPELNVSGFTSQIAAAAAQMPDVHTAAGFGPLEDQLTQTAVAIQGLLDARSAAYAQLGDARATLAAAQADGLPIADAASVIATVARQLPTAPDTPTFQAMTAQLAQQKQMLADAIWTKENQLYWNAGPGKLIVVSLSKQVMTAFQDGTPVLSSYVTTGRPWMPTPPGVYSIMAKYSPYLMVSPWAYGTGAWYPPSWTNWAMLFRSGGYFIHDAPWRTWYGPGSDVNAGTHGCINVPYGPMSTLYGWTTIGTTVVVTW